MPRRVVALLGALLFGGNAILGIGFSGATWTGASRTALAVIAANDWTPPTVTVSPLASTVQGTVTVTATASDARSAIDPASVVVEYRAANAATWTSYAGCARAGSNPLTATCSWNTATLPDGGYEVRARAADTAGYATTSATVTTTLRNAIAVRLTPVSAYLRGTVDVTGAVVNNGGPTSGPLLLEYAATGTTTFTQLNNSCSAAAASTLTCAWNSVGVTDGRYDVRARAVAATTATDTQSGVTVDNTAPTATLTVPAGVLSGTVALSATATDATSGVASVDVQYRTGANAWSSCAPVTGSYTCSLDTNKLVQGASYDFRAVVTDRAGNAATVTPASQGRVVDNTAATVAVTSPAASAVLGGTTTVTVNAGSPRGVASVRVEYGASATGPWTTACTAAGTGATTSASYSCSWDTRPLTGGTYYVRAVAVETYGGGTPASLPVRITVDNTDGQVSVTSPAAGTVSGTVTLQASPTSPTGVTSVALQVRKGATGAWTTICTPTSSPYSCAWSTPTEYNTTWQVQAVMTQGNQRIVTSAAVDVTVRNAVGSVSITSPTDGSTVRGSTVTLSASATSNAPIGGVKFRITSPGTAVPDCAGTLSGGIYSCSVSTAGITYGTYTVTAVMTYGTTQTATSTPVTVTVDNRVLTGADVQGTTGTTNGQPDAGDTITLTYSGLADLNSIQPGLSYGGTLPLNAVLRGAPGFTADTLSFPGSNIGGIGLASNFGKNNTNYSYTGSTLSAASVPTPSGPVTVLTIKLGQTPAGLTPNPAPGTMTWTPSATTTDLRGGPCSTAVVTESGASDLDF